MKGTFHILASFTVIGAASVARADVIDFEQFSHLDNIAGLDLGGVVLTNANGGSVLVEDNTPFGYHSATKSIHPSPVSTLIGTFTEPVEFVRLWAGDTGGDEDLWELEAFDAGHQSLGLVQSGGWDGTPYSELSIAVPGIKSFEARWTGIIQPIGYDDLEFYIPAPGAASLLLLASLGMRRRRA